MRREGVVDQIHCEGADGNTNSACQGDQQAWMVNTGVCVFVCSRLYGYEDKEGRGMLHLIDWNRGEPAWGIIKRKGSDGLN